MTRDYSSCLDFESLKKAARNAIKKSAGLREIMAIMQQLNTLYKDDILTSEQYRSLGSYLCRTEKYALCTDLESLKEEFDLIKGLKYKDFHDFVDERRGLSSRATELYDEGKISLSELVEFTQYTNAIDFDEIKWGEEYDVDYDNDDYDEDDESEDGSFDDSGYSSRMVNDSDMAPGDDYLMDIGVVDVDDYD